MNKLFRTLIIGSMALAVVSCGGKKEEKEEVEKVEKVKVSTLNKTTIAQHIELSTTLQGYETMNIAPAVTGRIEHIYHDVGSKVKAGDMLVRMDQTQLNTTKLTFANLEVDYKRVKSLYESGTIPQQTYDQTKLGYEQTKENLAFLTENTFVKARIPGVISAKNYEDGELYAGTPILVLTQIHVLKAIINIPESYFPLVKKGLKLQLHSDIYPNQAFDATIETVYPTIDAATHTFQAKLKIPNDKELLRPGMFVRTTLELGEFEAFIAPYQAVLKLIGSNNRYVFLNNNGVAKRVEVTMGQRFDDLIEIKANGIKEGDEIVTIGQGKLVNGVKLEIIK
ncbi:MAG: efflux RND transporter periplasmic adaptor subunit [Bacteroidales bacterium]|nr:efflux RND transporter periplasmic adaptor subunit [Bacteroidales bacterium]MDD4671926.1 efflux RND transporter periplasmic adaptor subunit [Bacteroidales bacterium]MDY0348539.1 efflux RND transporter periplasmic adaptor subunit [Tenuifilaceae bacterium]